MPVRDIVGVPPRSLRRRLALATLAAVSITACLPKPEPASAPAPHATPSLATGTERTAGRTPSTDSEVTAFLAVLARRTGRTDAAGNSDSTLGAAPFLVAAYDTTSTGALIPFVVAARPAIPTARDAHAQGRVIVFIEAGAQSTTGDGTDALLATLRDLLTHDTITRNVLDSIVLVAVPRARLADTLTNPTAPDTDLVLGTALDSRTTFAILHAWDPDVVIDLQSGDLGGAAYPVVTAPPLTPAALFAGPFTADTLVPELRRRLEARDRIHTFPCGTVVPPYSGADDDTAAHVWAGCDHRARVLTNYAGLRNRVGLLARANHNLPLTQRVAALSAFLRQALSLVAEQRSNALAHITDADTTVEAWGADPGRALPVPLRADRARGGPMVPILVEAQPSDARRHPKLMSVEDQEPASPRRPPLAYVLQPGDSATARLLGRHGITVQHHSAEQRVTIVERFIIDSVTAPPTHFTGHWLRVIADTTLAPGSYIVPAGQPLGLLLMQLLEPESDDGLAAWHIYDRALHKGAAYPVFRLLD